MTTSLFSILATRLSLTDPHGWILTIISICVVFGCLLVLFGLYSLSGALFGKKSGRKSGMRTAQDTEAAIAFTLYLFLNGTEGRKSPGNITIKKTDSAWGDKTLTFRRLPRK